MATTAKQISGNDDLATLDPARADRFADETAYPIMERLRREAPIHYCPDSVHGPYWSITHYEDVAAIEARHEEFSSAAEWGGISLIQPERESNTPRIESFIAMDPPGHTARRRTVAPAFTPSEMKRLEGEIQARTAELLDGLPVGETIDWVDRVSIELTTGMLAILFDFPWEDRRKLTEWSDWISSEERLANDPEQRLAKMFEMATYFSKLWEERKNAPPAPDLISMMVHSSSMSEMTPEEFIGNLALLVVGGNDTTRNSMSAAAVAFNRWPEEWERILADPSLIPNAVSEVIRFQSPVAHMRRTAVRDIEYKGHQFKQGDKIVLWYLAANRDEALFPEGERFIADRANARRHLAFGYGIHRCVGARLAELQIQTLFAEMAKREMRVEIVGDVERAHNCFINSIQSIPVEISRS
jgi:cytochrome P450